MNLRYFLALIVYCSVIFYESSHQIPFQADQKIPGMDKVVHAAIYGGLAAIVSVGMRRSWRTYSPWVQFLVPIAVAMLYGASDELHQHFVPGRKFDPWDELANTSGAFLMQYYLCVRRWGLPLDYSKRSSV